MTWLIMVITYQIAFWIGWIMGVWHMHRKQQCRAEPSEARPRIYPAEWDGEDLSQ